MAPNSEQPKPADKGKGKAVDNQAGENKKGKDAPPQANGKKNDDKIDCVFSVPPIGDMLC